VDDVDADVMDASEGALVDGLTGLLEVCSVLREHRVARGLGLDTVAVRCGYELTAIEWIDDGDVAAPAEALIYYAAALGLTVRFTVLASAVDGGP
jgi:hypothetical protein